MEMRNLEGHLAGDAINDLDIDQGIGAGQWATALSSGLPIRIDFNLFGTPTLTGIANVPDGTMLYLRNTQPIDGNSPIIGNLPGSEAGNQFSLPSAAFTLEPQQCVICVKNGQVLTGAS
ncbi:MAG TPA: hypothetical protein VNE18_00815 [Rhodanobacter sp.]|nr:hypothetical protein [Rhodanobacter sp.]